MMGIMSSKGGFLGVGNASKIVVKKEIFPLQKKMIELDLCLRDNFIWFGSYEVT